MIQENLDEIIKELTTVLSSCDFQSVDNVIQNILDADKIYIAGVGRTGYVMRGFAMRLMHLGFCAYIIGDTETPSAGKRDLLILGSGSGETATLKSYGNKANELGMKVITFTSFTHSSLGKASNITIQISAPTKDANKKAGNKSIQPMGSLFEQALMLYTDALVLEIIKAAKIDPSSISMRHANLE